MIFSNADAGAPRHIRGLDGLRALSVIAVVWQHTHPGFSGWPATARGFLGVDVFFVLSGFLITTLLLNEQAKTGDISLKNFYIRRSLRIFPLYYALLALMTVYFALAPSSSSQRQAFFHELPYHLSYTSNWIEVKSLLSITWSLSTEEQFYLIWPPLLVLLGRRALPALLGFLLLNEAVNFGLLDGVLASVGLPYLSRHILHATFAPILLGVLLAFALRSPVTRPTLERLVGGWGLMGAALAMLVIANLSGDTRGPIRLAFHLATVWLLAGVYLRQNHPLVSLLEWRPLAHVGVVSYGVYLLHKPVLDVCVRLLARVQVDSPMVLFAGCLAATVAVATLSFRYFEQPLLRMRDLYRSDAPIKSAAAAA